MNPATTAPIVPSIVRLAWNAALPKSCSKLVLMCLAYHACKNERDECFPYVETVARLCGMHPRTASLQLGALARAGLVAVVPRPGRSSIYRLNRDRLEALSSERAAADDAGSAQSPATLDPVNPVPLPPVFPALDPVIPAPLPGESCTHKGELRGMKEEGKEDARETATDQMELDPFPLPVLEDLKAEQPQQPAIGEPAALVAEQPQAPVLDAAALAAINAQRATNGKREPVNLDDLAQQAKAAGITPQAAAQWILSKPGRNFFRADFYRPETEAAATMTGPVELTEAGKRAQAQIARALSSTAVPARPAAVLVAGPSARPIGAAVTLRQRAPVNLGATTGTGWAHRAVARFVAAEPVSHATITSAAVALGLSLSDLKAQRAVHMAQEGAAA